MINSRFTLAPVPPLGAALALLIAAYSTAVLAMLGAPPAPEASTARGAAAEPGGKTEDYGSEPSDKSPRYTCPMHPEVDSDEPGRCPHCGMKLVEKEKSQHGGQS